MPHSKIQRVCLITGVSSGIGLAIAKSLITKSYIVYGISRTPSAETELLSQQYPAFSHHSIDVSKTDQLQPLLRYIWTTHKSLNLLVHSAGIPHGGLLALTKPEDFSYIFQVNYFAPIFLSQHASRYMSKSRLPQIIFISSSSAFRFDPGTLAYASSKAAINYATKQLSFEFSPLSIRVNCIAPGVTDTPMLRQMSPRAIECQLNSSASSSICQPSHISSIVEFLDSESSVHINGQILRIDGGLP